MLTDCSWSIILHVNVQLFESSSSSHDDMKRASLWHKYLIALTRLGEDPEEAASREQEEIEASEAEKAENHYGDDDEDQFEEDVTTDLYIHTSSSLQWITLIELEWER